MVIQRPATLTGLTVKPSFQPQTSSLPSQPRDLLPHPTLLGADSGLVARVQAPEVTQPSRRFLGLAEMPLASLEAPTEGGGAVLTG